MALVTHVLSAIDDFGQGKLDNALMHASFSIEATARKLYNIEKAGRSYYKKCIREYYWIIEPMIGSGLNLVETKWNNLEIIDDSNNKVINNPDLADVIYHIYRCNYAHAKSVSKNYRLLPTSDGKSTWVIANNVLQIPDRIIWALLAVSVFSKANKNINSLGDYFLSWGSENLGIGISSFIIKEWWGREEDFRQFLLKQNLIRVKLEL